MGNVSTCGTVTSSRIPKDKLKGFQAHGLNCNRKMQDEKYEQSSKYIKDKVDENSHSDKWLDCPYTFKNLVLSGGGAKGYSYLGALKALEDCGILSNITSLAGSSIGSILAGLLAVGYTSQDIANVFSTDLKHLFADVSCVGCFAIPNIVRRNGIFPGKRFYKFYGNQLKRKTGNADITFEQVRKKYGYVLCVVATNLTEMRSEWFTPNTTPDVPIRLAIRMSISLPLIFQPVHYKLHGKHCVFIDGAMLDVYPIDCFDDSEGLDYDKTSKTLGMYLMSESPAEYTFYKAMFGREVPNRPTYLPTTSLAKSTVKILEKTEIQEFKWMRRKRKKQNMSIRKKIQSLKKRFHASPNIPDAQPWPDIHHDDVRVSRFGELVSHANNVCLLNAWKQHVKPTDHHRTITINCGHINTDDFNLDEQDLEFLVKQGYECARRFLTTFSRWLPCPPTSAHETSYKPQSHDTHYEILSPETDRKDKQVSRKYRNHVSWQSDHHSAD